MSEELPQPFGPNAWLVEEMFEQYRANPTRVSAAWQEFFADYKSSSPSGLLPPPPVDAAPVSVPAAVAPTQPAVVAEPVAELGEPIRGVGAVIVTNMEKSLGVPTATSFRNVPAKLLEINRRVMNGYLGRKDGGKVSFTDRKSVV